MTDSYNVQVQPCSTTFSFYQWILLTKDFVRVKCITLPNSLFHMCFFPFSSWTCFACTTVFLQFSALKSASISSMAFQMCWPNRYESWVTYNKTITEQARGSVSSQRQQKASTTVTTGSVIWTVPIVFLPCQGWRTCWRCGMWWGFPQQLYKTHHNHHRQPGNTIDIFANVFLLVLVGAMFIHLLNSVSLQIQFNSLGQIHHQHPHISGTCWCQLNWAAAVESGW